MAENLLKRFTKAYYSKHSPNAKHNGYISILNLCMLNNASSECALCSNYFVFCKCVDYGKLDATIECSPWTDTQAIHI